jgi:predicted DNA-binding protein (MmcQ/YjbR family)
MVPTARAASSRARALLEDSYNLVVKSLTRAQRAALS